MFTRTFIRLLTICFFLTASISVVAEMRLKADQRQVDAGEEIFLRRWRASTDAGLPGEGLGPLYNAVTCAACHINNGRGRPSEAGNDDPSFVLRLSIPPQNEADRLALALGKKSLIGEPHYGQQLQTRAVGKALGEGRVQITYHDKTFTFDDGEKAVLRRPAYSVDRLAYGALSSDFQISPRMAQPLHGLGLLAKIPEARILAFADANDKDGDGVSGRANRVWDQLADKFRLGRFGWKASEPSLLQQSTAAFAHDMGISSPFMPQTAPACDRDDATCQLIPKPSIKGYEIGMVELRQVVAYLDGLPAPERGGSGGEPSGGEKLFNQIGCASCHRPSFDIVVKNVAGKGQFLTIYPYSDLLLHDLGAGLADHRPVAEASGWEWRTQPLWGIGRAGAVNGNAFFLHDGRARTIEEAILWHGGEASASRAKYAALGKSERADLIEFISGL